MSRGKLRMRKTREEKTSICDSLQIKIFQNSTNYIAISISLFIIDVTLHLEQEPSEFLPTEILTFKMDRKTTQKQQHFSPSFNPPFNASWATIHKTINGYINL